MNVRNGAFVSCNVPAYSEDMTVVSHLLTRSQVADVGNNWWRCQQWIANSRWHCQQSVALPTVGGTANSRWHCQQSVALPTPGGKPGDPDKYI